MRSLFTLLFFYLALDAHALADQVSDSVSGAIEETTEAAVAEEVERGVEEAVETSVTDSVSESVEDSVEASVSGVAERAVEESVEQSVEDTVNSAVEESVAGAVQGQVEEAVSGSVQESVGETVDEAVSRSVEEGVGQAVSRAAEAGVLSGVEDTAGSDVGGVVGADIPAETEPAKDGGTVPGAMHGATGEAIFRELELESGWRAVHGEWLLALDAEELEKIRRTGITVVDVNELPRLGLTLVRIRAFGELDSFRELRELIPDAVPLDRNHIYDYRPQSGGDPDATGYSHGATLCESSVNIGMVDTAVNLDHPFLKNANIEQRDFSPRGSGVDPGHGSAVAGILVAGGGEVRGVVPDASISAAAVMYSRGDGSQGATAMSLIQALEWLASRQVEVINLSLAGPPNKVLERALNRLVEEGIPVVAAVGNAGPAAPPLYPAAYPSVLGVTAVDGEGRIYRWANRGDQVDFSAPGVNVRTLNGRDGIGTESGTSMAAPVVSALAACAREGQGAGELVDLLAEHAVDLGEPGRDATYGIGLLGAPSLSPQSLSRSASDASVSE